MESSEAFGFFLSVHLHTPEVTAWRAIQLARFPDAAVDRKHHTGNETRLIGCEEQKSLPLRLPARSIEALESHKPALCRQEMIPQQFVEHFRALLREEDSRSLQLHGWLCSGYRIGQPVRPLHRE